MPVSRPRLEEGDDAPRFSSTAFDGAPVVLDALLREGPVVLVFLRGFG